MSESTRTWTNASMCRRTALELLAGSGLALALAGCGGTAASDAGGAAGDAGAQPSSSDAASQAHPSLFSLAALPDEQRPEPACAGYTVEPNLANVIVPEGYYLNEQQLSLLEDHGFFVEADGWEKEFFKVYEENRYLHRPNFVTVDSLMHTYHLYFQYLLKGLERETLSNMLAELSAKMLESSVAQAEVLAGSEWQDAATRCMAFFGVGAKLLDPTAAIPESVSDIVAEEVARIGQAAGTLPSAVTGDYLDYTQYIVRGYYEGDETLERYFRAMMWYGQVSLYQKNEDHDRSALLVTLSLADDALSLWESIYMVTSFFVGASDDCGYYEYRSAIDEAYGPEVTAGDLIGNEEGWQAYRELTAQMRAPQINSLAGGSASDLDENKGFRFMGQRFTIDSAIFQKLVYDNVGEKADGGQRLLPDALDVPAAFGSDEALAILDEQGDTSYPNYSEYMQELREQVAGFGEDFWQASLYNQWQLTLQPLLTEKGEGYPPFMQSALWTRKALESFLGSYTELKHDTILYAKQALAEGDGALVDKTDDRGYVEPEPLVFSRLQRLCVATSQGLDQLGLIGQVQMDDLSILEQLAAQLATIASKELADELPTDEEFELIRSVGVQLEHFWEQAYAEEAERLDYSYLDARLFPASLVADVATGGSNCLELACGDVRTLYVVVSVEGSLRVASGPVFSFYQFAQPTSERLTDTTWRDMLSSRWVSPSEKTNPEPWCEGFLYHRSY